MFKVMTKQIVAKKNENGLEEHLMIPRKGGKTFGVVNCYKVEYSAVGEGFTFQEAKEVRSQIKDSWIVRQ